MNYDRYKSLARQSLKEYGTRCILEKDSRIYSKELHDYVIESVKIGGVGLVREYNIKDIDGQLIQQGDVNILFQKDAYIKGKPEIGSCVVFGDSKYKIINIRKIAPNGVDVILYDIQGRQ